MAMYDGALTVVRILDGDSDIRKSVLIPLLFIIVMNIVSRELLGRLPSLYMSFYMSMFWF